MNTQEQVEQLQTENAQLRAEVEDLKLQRASIELSFVDLATKSNVKCVELNQEKEQLQRRVEAGEAVHAAAKATVSDYWEASTMGQEIASIEKLEEALSAFDSSAGKPEKGTP